MAKRRKLDPNRFKQNDEKGIFSFDPIRRDVFKWGLIGGGIGGALMLNAGIFWQIMGVLAVVFISNHHINKAARRIPRWHAVINSFLGVMLAMFGVILLGSMAIAYVQGTWSFGQ
jgi:uncharacterized membrane protein